MLRPLCSVSSLGELRWAKAQGLKEALIAIKDFSRMGTLDLEEGKALAMACSKQKIRAIFQWDILMTQNIFKKTTSLLSAIHWKDFSAIRLACPGALFWAMENLKLPIQWNVQMGTANLLGLRSWEKYIGDRLERLILSCETPKEKLKHYCSSLKTPIEILGLGPLLLLYTPRHLLNDFVGAKGGVDCTVTATSEESAHKDFPVKQNGHGTFLFHQKHFGLLEYARELAAMGVGYLYFDWQELDQHLKEMALELLKTPCEDLFLQFKKSYPAPLIRGFFHSNKSDVLFPKLKNERLTKYKKDALGEVIGVEKGNLLGVELWGRQGLRVGKKYVLKSPEGKSIGLKLERLCGPGLNETNHQGPGLAFIGHIKGIGTKSLILEEKEH